jgi:Mn-dependent DtxR family transcriptional regulator
MLVRLGQMSQTVFDVAKKCQGKLTTNDIAYELKMSLKEVVKSLHTLEDMDMLEWKEVG